MTIKLTLIILSILCVSEIIESLSIQERSYKVFRGHEIRQWKENLFKFVVMLYGKAVCTGSIFSSWSIVTASHCFQKPDSLTDVIFEWVGYGQKYIAYQKIPVKSIFVNPAYTNVPKEYEVNGFDVATIELARPIIIGQLDVTVATFWNANEIPYDTKVFVVGYGMDTSRNDHAGNLKWGNQIYVRCPYRYLIGSPLCVRISSTYNEENTEGGDSGGPLLKELYPKKFLVMGTLSGEIKWFDGVSIGIYGSTKLNWKFIEEHVKN